MMSRHFQGRARQESSLPSINQFSPRPFVSSETQHVILGRESVSGRNFIEIDLFPKIVLQPKLKIGSVSDKYEQEADRLAERMVRMPEACPKCRIESEDKDADKFRTKPIAGHTTLLVQREMCREATQTRKPFNQNHQLCPGLESKILLLNRGGRPLPGSACGFFEPRFGHDFSQVRVHTDAKAARLAEAVSARAFTLGRDIVFGTGQYAPDTFSGRRLLAHELTHVIQQQDNPIGVNSHTIQRAVECDEFGNCQSVPEPRATVSIAPPGDCTPEMHAALQREVIRACKRGRRCNLNDDCSSIWENIEANAECIRARSRINAKCFRGGNSGHIEAVAAAVNSLINCWAVYDRKCSRKTPPPVPVPVPEPVRETRPKPVVDKSFMERMAAITGLTGAALVAYLIISEGSRLFPPRNLLPIP